MGIFFNIDESVLTGMMLIIFLAAAEIGFWFGLKRVSIEDKNTRDHISSLQAALLGLLALMLGFTFSMSLSRYDKNKDLVLAESNAIGTTYLRAKLLPEPQQSEIVRMLSAYVDSRMDFYNAGIDRNRITAANATATRLQQQLWTVAITMTELDTRSVPLGLFIQSLNDAIDLNTDRLELLQNRVPLPVLAVVSVLAVVTLAFIGYGCGLHGRRHFVSTALVSLLLVIVMTVIIDLDRPRRGLIKVSQESMLSLQESLRQPMP
jgi:hypothetical protein